MFKHLGKYPWFQVVIEIMSPLSEDYLFVVAIDFGTTYSGYAFSSRDDFKSDPLKIVANQVWNAGSQRHLSLKTPTCLLLNDNEELQSFGYEAENRYSDIVLDRQQNEYFFFQRFKMQLYNNQHIKSDMIMEDVTGKPMSAMKVFSESIKALKQHLFETFKERGLDIKDNVIRYVLTVPAIWCDAAKQFMRKSANMAGIKNNQLALALEPEAASIYCQHLSTEKLQGAEKDFTMSAPGTEYMVLDLGGGTADITVHEKLLNGSLKEMCRASGGDCVGSSIDSAFFQIFVKLVGGPLMNTIKKENPSVYLDIFREFEAVKRTIDAKKTDKLTMTIPRTMLDELCKIYLNEEFNKIVEQSTLKNQLKVQYDKLRIDPQLIKDLFKEASKKIVCLVSDVYKGKSLQMIVMVGGFSQCKIIQDIVKEYFPLSKVIVPEDAGLAVLKGATLFGHRPDYIVSRVLRYTYGINCRRTFDPEKHDEARKRTTDYGNVVCRGCFSVFAKLGSEILIGDELFKRQKTNKEYESTCHFEVFRSTSESPLYTDDEGCVSLGELKVEIPNPTKERRLFNVKMVFGNTEFEISATDIKTGKTCKTSFDLI